VLDAVGSLTLVAPGKDAMLIVLSRGFDEGQADVVDPQLVLQEEQASAIAPDRGGETGTINTQDRCREIGAPSGQRIHRLGDAGRSNLSDALDHAVGCQLVQSRGSLSAIHAKHLRKLITA